MIRTKGNQVAGASRWAEGSHDVLDFLDRPDCMLDFLDGQRRRWEGRVLIPASDRALQFLSRNLRHLEDSFRIASPPRDVADRVLEKDRTLQAAAEVGVPHPKIYGPATPVTTARDDLRFPLLVKPVVSHAFTARFGGHKLFVANNRQELDAAVARLDGVPASLVDHVPGGDDQLFSYSVFLDPKGQVTAEFGYRKLRKSPPGFGVARLAEGWDPDPVRDGTLALLRHIGWTGLATVEYKFDRRDRSYRLIEVNGRAYLTMGLAVRSGVDYPYLAWCQASGRSAPVSRLNGWRGVWADLRAEVLYGLVLREVEGLSFREVLSPYRGRPRTWAVWSASDPGPSLTQLREAFGYLRARLRPRSGGTRGEGMDRFRGPSPPPAGAGQAP